MMRMLKPVDQLKNLLPIGTSNVFDNASSFNKVKKPESKWTEIWLAGREETIAQQKTCTDDSAETLVFITNISRLP